MKIRAKIGGELTLHGFGVHWIHKAGDVRDFPEDVGKRILTNDNYEKTYARKSTEKTETIIKKTEKQSSKKIKRSEVAE